MNALNRSMLRCQSRPSHSTAPHLAKNTRRSKKILNKVILGKGFALDIPFWLRLGVGVSCQKMCALGCCSGSLPSRIREAGINGLLPAARVPSIYSVSRLRVLDCSLPEQREGHCNLRSGRFCESSIRKLATLLGSAGLRVFVF